MLTNEPLSINIDVIILDDDPKLTPPDKRTVGKFTVPETVPAPMKYNGPGVVVKSPVVATIFPLFGITNCLAFKSNFPAVNVGQIEELVYNFNKL